MKDRETIRQSFEYAYDEFLEPIFLFLCARLNNRERAKELAQETFMRTWKYLADGNTITNIRPFLYTTAYNLFKNELRSKHETSSLDTLLEERGFEPRDTGMPIEEKLELKLMIESIKELPEPHQEVLLMRYVDGLAVKEIAALLDESPITISVRIHRAVAKLRTRYGYETKTKTA